MKKIKEYRDVKFYDKLACRYIKRIGLSGMEEQVFYDELADFINFWRGKLTGGCFHWVNCEDCNDKTEYCLKNK